MTRSFAITFDYLCPFARNANEQVVAALDAGADFDVRFLPYSLAQGHVADGETAIWDREDPNSESGILAFQVGLTVRDHFPELFNQVHVALFAARHDEGLDIKERDVLRRTLDGLDVDTDAVFEIVDSGKMLDVLQTEHEAGVDDYDVWGVPTFIAGGRGVFVRLLDRPEGDGEAAAEQIGRVVDMVERWPNMHEFKQTNLPV